MAVVQKRRGDRLNGFDRAGHVVPQRTALGADAAHEPLVYLKLRAVFVHPDLLGDDAALLVDALLREVRHGHERQQRAEVLVEPAGAVEVVGGHGHRRERVRVGPGGGQRHEGVAVGRVEHLVLEVVGDPGGGVDRAPVQREAAVGAAVVHRENGGRLAVAGLRHDADGQAVRQDGFIQRLADGGVFTLRHRRRPPLRT